MSHELFMSEDFNYFRKMEMAMMTNTIWKLLQNEPEKAAGAIVLAKNLINLPDKLSSSQDVKAKTKEVMNRFKVSFIQQD